VAEAVAQRLKRDKLGRAIDTTAGVLQRGPSGMNRDAVSAWVERLRTEDSD
jgi:hypothetical protein